MMKKIIITSIFYLIGYLSLAQNQRIIIDSTLNSAITTMHLEHSKKTSQAQNSKAGESHISMIHIADKQLSKVLYLHSVYKAIISDDVKYYSVSLLPNISLAEEGYCLVMIAPLEPYNIRNNSNACVINNSIYMFDLEDAGASNSLFAVSKNIINIAYNNDDIWKWNFDGIDRCYFYLYSHTGDVYTCSVDWSFQNQNEQLDSFDRIP